MTLGKWLNRLGLLCMYCMPAMLWAQEEAQLIQAGRYLDLTSGELIENVHIRVQNGLIHSIGEGKAAGQGGTVIDLSDYTLLPGLIDTHTHLCDNAYMGDDFDYWTYPAATFGIVGTVNARITLEAGFTTVRNVSEPFYADIALRDAINKGWIAGPRMYVSGPMITMSGGHGNWGNWIASQHQVITQAHMVADGPDEVRKAVRLHIKHGVDLIKIAATGGFGTPGSIPGAASYTVEEMSAAVVEARKRGLKVAAHAHGAEGIKNALAAGVWSIEHAALIDAEAIRLMKEQDVFLVMDLLSAHYDLVEINQDYSDKQLGSSNAQEFANYMQRFGEAHRAGVKMAFGTDASVYPHGRNGRQFSLMVKAGMTPLEAIRAATTTAAALIGIEDQTGTIEPGKWADMIAVRGNPLEDVRVLEEVVFVMKDGRVHKWTGQNNHR
ncbi:metal-dependent hydrolase family protein [Bowmanella dokdonensis]|uniref:Amidohydrolase family protein n=1 Tax=Bowmanella dokdonensis TaxID=751969 RepID=A0A939DR47_9ALTE|nr:amidohydrolase family protein [Bowmanella dokdonensis]MBN7827255.1 amidohydrolase family protein [Bowmanella dokdonensis]